MGLGGNRIRLARGAVPFVALVLGLGASAGSAAKAKKIQTRAGDLFVDADSVSGTVSSGRDECERGRKVKLRSASGGNKVVASIKTTKTGGWEIATQLPAGSFYAQVPKVSKQGKQHGHKVKLICSGAKTKTVTI